MSNEEHEHRWGAWSYGGYETEMRTCTCGGCPGADYRQHKHNYKKTSDMFAPMGSSLMIEVCSGPTGCGDTKRG